jgi:hypothetical protein
MTAPPHKPSPLAHVWASAPLVCGGACLALFFWLVIGRPAPPEGRLLLEVAAVIGFVVAALSWASVVGGGALLEENSPAEPLRLREAGWIMGVPVGIPFGILLIVFRAEMSPDNYFDLYVRPLVVAIALSATLWAVLTRMVLKREGLTADDYACAPFMNREVYEPLARRKLAWRHARKARKLTLAEAQQHMPDIVPALADRLRTNDDDLEDKHILDLLGSLGEKSVGPALIEALDAERGPNRRAAAIALGKLELLEAAPKLSQVALEDKRAEVRRAAVVALGKLRADIVLPALVQAIQDKDAPTRQSACVALGKLKSQDALPALQACLQDGDPQVRKSAARAIKSLTGVEPQVTDPEAEK